MAVSINDGGLVWTARIDDSKIPDDIKQLQKMFAELKIDFINADSTALSLKKVQENVVASQKEIFNIQETSNAKLNADLVTSAAITQDKITDIVIAEAKIRTDASRDEAQALLNSQLPTQRTGLPGKPTKQTPEIDDILGSDASKQLREAENLYGQLDQSTKEFVAELVELEIELGKVDAAQKKLNKANREGKISNDDYVNGTQVLSARQKEIADSIQLITKRQKDYDAATANDISSINGKNLALKQLVAQYRQLSEAERQTTQGKELAANIRGIANELDRLKRAGTTGFDEMGNAIKRQVGLLEKLKRQAEIYKTGIQQATLPANIAKYNQKLEATNLEIVKLGNAGKKGFDVLGNSTDQLTKKTNLLSKGFGFFRQAAFLIPGLGMAGIFNLIGEGVSALVTQLFKGNGALKTFAANFQNIKEVMASANKESGKQITDLKILYTAATNVNLSMKERLAAVNALQEEFPDYFGKIDDEVIANGKAQKSYDELVLSIQSASRARAAKDKLDQIQAEKLDIQFQKLKIENAVAAEKARAKEQTFVSSTGGSFGQGASTESRTETKAEAQAIIEKRRLKAIREQEKKEVSLDQQEKFLITFAGEKAITKVVVDEHTKRLKETKAKEDTELNSLLEKRKTLLQSIIELERDALQSGLTKQATEIDKINERREKELQLLKETNAAIDKYNAKHKVNIAKVGQAEIARINNAADTLIKNATYKKDAAEYLESIAEKEKAFDDFQKVQETGSTILIEHARDANKTQLGDFENFVDLLQAEYDRLFDTLNFDSSDDIGTVTRFNGIKKKLDDAIKKATKNQVDLNEENLNKLLQQTETFNQERFKINKKYNDLEATLEKEKGRFSPEELKARQKAITEGREADLTDLENNILRQSDLYKKLSTDIIGYTRTQIKALIKELETVLKLDKTLTPQMKADIQGAIDQYKGLLNETNKVSKDFGKAGDQLGQVSGIFGELAGSVEGLNDGFSDVLQTLSDITSIAADAANAIAQFASGNIIGGIASTVSAITKVLGIGKQAREERRRQQEEVQGFITAQFVGEQEINLLFQERARQQVLINKLRIEGLEAEKDLLIEQRQEILKNYQTVFDELQKQSFKSVKELTAVGYQHLKIIVDEALLGKTFDEIEQLFLKGQLEGKAKELFLALQKIKDSGVDIDRLLEQNKIAAQELFTGTTSEGIADSIIQGLEEGKRSVSDFADTFQDLMQQAFLNSLKFKYLEGPIKSFFEDFAAASESDGQLTGGEIDRLKSMYNSIITNAADQFEQLQQVAGINFNSSGSQGNTLTGAIKGMTEQQAELLAGQFGGLRISVIEQLKVATQGIKIMQNIEINTFRLHEVRDILRRVELDGIKVK